MSRARHRKDGGRTEMWVSGNPDVKKEAEGKESYDKGDERKHGGRKRKHGGHVDGSKGKHRADRPMRKHGGGIPGRKRGGAVGADRSPLSTAYKSTSAEKLPKEQDGGASPE